MQRIAGYFAVLTLFINVGCQPMEQATTQPDDPADIEAIHAVRDAYLAAESAGDAAAVAALYADNGVMMPFNQPAVSGRAAIEAHLQQEYSMMTMELTGTSRETEVMGDVAYDVGSHTVRMTPKEGGDTMEATGKHIVTLARQSDGSWKITNLIFNTDAPMPPMAPPGNM
jgi:uncharacterized protein (TIGR02246 family)